MARPEKENAINNIAEKLTGSTGVYLANFQGLDVEKITELRNQLREASIEFKVVKNTLARISVKNAGFEELLQYLQGPTAMAFCLADPIIGARILSEFQKKNEKLGLKACLFDGQVYDQKRIVEIAKLPAKEMVLAQTVGTIAGPLRNMVNVIHALLWATVNVLDQIRKQKEN
jgi:large subunit ribosomal protein L10